MTQGMRRKPWISDAGAVRGAGEHPHHAVVAERVMASLTATADEEYQACLCILWPLAQHVVVDRRQCPAFQQVDYPLSAGFLPHTLRVVVPESDGDPSASIRNVLQMQAQRLTGAQSASCMSSSRARSSFVRMTEINARYVSSEIGRGSASTVLTRRVRRTGTCLLEFISGGRHRATARLAAGSACF
jgi:hypothetical protein